MNDPSTELFLAWRRRRDPRLLGEVFDATAPELVKLALHLVGDVATAEDLVQQTFMVAIESPEDFASEGFVAAWLAGVLANRARRHRREQAREVDPERLTAALEAPDPAQLAADRDLSAALLEALDGLPEPYRAVALLRFHHGLEPLEIAHTLERSPGTVRSQLHRAVALLRRSLPAGVLPAWVTGFDPAPSWGSLRERIVAAASKSEVAVNLAGVGALMTSAKSWIGAALVLLAVAFVGEGLRGLFAGSGHGEGAAIEAGEAGLVLVHGVAEGSRALEELESIAVVERVPVRSESVSAAAASAVLDGALAIRVHRAGSPVAGRELLVRPGSAIEAPASNGRTDSQGRFRLDGIVPGDYEVELAGGERRTARIEAGHTATIEFDLVGSARVRGTTVDPSGMAVPDAVVFAQVRGGRILAVARSRDDGSFEFDGAVGRVRLHATKPGWSARGSATPNFMGRDADHVELVLAPGSAGVDLTVVDPAGQPVIGAAVDAIARVTEVRSVDRGPFESCDQPPGASGLTDAAGRLRLDDLSPGPYFLTVRAAGFAVQQIDHEVGDEASREITLEPGVEVAGRVTGSDGRPVKGAAVYFGIAGDMMPWSEARIAALTDAAGRYVLPLVPRRSAVRLSAASTTLFGRSVSQSIDTREGRTRTVDFELPQLHLIAGRLVSATGEPLEGWGLRFVAEQFSVAGLAQGASGPDGRFELQLQSDQQGTLSVFRPGQLSSREVASWDGIVPGGPSQDFSVPAIEEESALISMRVVDQAGRPLDDAVVDLWMEGEDPGPDARRRTAVVPGAPVVTLGPMPPGAVMLEVTSSSCGSLVVGPLVLEPGETTEVEARFEQPGCLRFEWATGASISNYAAVQAQGAEVGTRIWRDRAGRWWCPPLQPGRYLLRILDSDRAREFEGLVIEAGETLDLGRIDLGS
ncbi:sigma-70 family RNA polymerase sigma factor [Engelhardtia mirabilis]|uniref:sigma-70 family RNA polymerase sigma factor n=1 Tax=Engelhardtia mirabilis TaxID=2528011 RepID=UPI003AF35168